MSTEGELRGYDAEGHRVVVGWVTGGGEEMLVGLTKCCQAAVSVFSDDGTIYCKGCYEQAPWHLAGEAVLATDANGNPVQREKRSHA